MSKTGDIFSVQIGVQADATPPEIDSLTRALLKEIDQDIELESSGLKTETAPTSTRSGEAITIGMIILALLPVFFDKMVNLVISWTQRHKECRVTLSLSTKKGHITVEYDPRKMSQNEIKKALKEAKQALEAKDSK